MKTVHKSSQYMAELIGTFFLVFFGCGSMILAELQSGYHEAIIPIVFGGAVSIMIYATGHISGAHFNPAVTMAFWSIGHFPLKRVPGYVLAQLSGATLASLVHMIIWGKDHSFGKTVLSVSPQVGFFVEIILSFALMFVIASVATDSRAVGELAGIAIGSTVALCAFVGGPITNASMNPVRTIGPAVMSLDFSHLGVYIFAPILGTVAGAWTYQWVKCHEEVTKGEGHGCC